MHIQFVILFLLLCITGEEEPDHQMGQLGEEEAEQLDRSMWAPEEDDDQVGYSFLINPRCAHGEVTVLTTWFVCHSVCSIPVYQLQHSQFHEWT